MPYRYPHEFRRRVLDLIAAGRSVASVAVDLAASDQTIYIWLKQELVDTGQAPGLARFARSRIPSGSLSCGQS